MKLFKVKDGEARGHIDSQGSAPTPRQRTASLDFANKSGAKKKHDSSREAVRGRTSSAVKDLLKSTTTAVSVPDTLPPIVLKHTLLF
jgi:hypothetical protein